MRRFISVALTLSLPVLIIANMLIFVSGISLGDQISRFERDTLKLHGKNMELSKQVSYVDSLQHAASLAATLDFTNASRPVILDNITYALNR